MPKDDSKAFRHEAGASAGSNNNDDDSKDKPKKVLRACDACHHRRVRCNHENPCDNCLRLNISCTWIKASKGKQASGRRIDLLRKGHNPAAATDLVPSPPGARLPAEHAAITNPSPSASRAILPPPGHSHPHPHPHPHAHSPRHYPPPPAGSAAMSPPGVPSQRQLSVPDHGRLQPLLPRRSLRLSQLVRRIRQIRWQLRRWPFRSRPAAITVLPLV